METQREVKGGGGCDRREREVRERERGEREIERE